MYTTAKLFVFRKITSPLQTVLTCSIVLSSRGNFPKADVLQRQSAIKRSDFSQIPAGLSDTIDRSISTD